MDSDSRIFKMISVPVLQYQEVADQIYAALGELGIKPLFFKSNDKRYWQILSSRIKEVISIIEQFRMSYETTEVVIFTVSSEQGQIARLIEQARQENLTIIEFAKCNQKSRDITCVCRFSDNAKAIELFKKLQINNVLEVGQLSDI